MSDIYLTIDEKLLILNQHANKLVEGEFRFLQYLEDNPELKNSEEMKQVAIDIQTQHLLINNEIQNLLAQRE